MYFHISNRNINEAYPLISAVAEVYTETDRETGLDFSVIDLNKIEDLLSVDAAARATDSMYSGIMIKGTTLALLRNGESFDGVNIGQIV